MKKINSVFSIVSSTLQVATKNHNKKFDMLLNELFSEDGPGGVALVVKDGKTLYRKAFGMANLELGVKMKPENVFRIGSITKQFTATAIMHLVEQGEINLNDDITKYIDDYPTHGHTITIEHLLTHTSGIQNYTDMEKWTSEIQKKDFTPEEMIDFFKSQPKDFAPGEEYKYSNSGYFLLGYIIEKLSKKTYAEYIHDTIFVPLEMKDSYYGGNAPIIKNRAIGYAKDEEGYKNAAFLNMTQPYSGGALLSTVDDLSKWYHAVMSDKVITKGSREKAHSVFTLNDGSQTDYGYGWSIGNVQGSSMVSHGGSINGFRLASNYLPEEKLFITVLSNCFCNNPADVAEKLAAIVIDKPFDWKQVSLKKELLKSYVAVYSSDSDGDRTITFDDEKLFSMLTEGSRHELLAFAKDKFFFEGGNLTLQFIRNSQDDIVSVLLKSSESDKTWNRTNKPIPTVIVIDEKQTS